MKSLLSLLLLPCGLYGYQYFYSDPLTSISSNWTQNGSSSPTSNGLTATSSTGGSLIYNGSVPGPTGEHETSITLALSASGGYYVAYLNATSNALLGSSSAAGSFYAAVLWDPTFTNGQCTATLALIRAVNGTTTWLSSGTVPCAQSTIIRAVHTYAN